MNVEKLEAVLKPLLKDDTYNEVDLEYNDFKSCYQDTIQDYESALRPYTWATKEDQQVAYEKNTVWELAVHRKNQVSTIKAASCASVLLGAIDITDPEAIEQLDAMTAFFDRLLLGEYCMASFSYTTGGFYNTRHPATGKWVEARDSVADIASTEMEADDWISEESMNQAIAQNGFWRIHWYPHTPIGFYDIASHSLQALVDHIEAKIASGEIEVRP